MFANTLPFAKQCSLFSGKLEKNSAGVTSFLSHSQKIFMDLKTEGFPVIETSTLTEEGVIQVKTEVGVFVLEKSVWWESFLFKNYTLKRILVVFFVLFPFLLNSIICSNY